MITGETEMTFEQRLRSEMNAAIPPQTDPETAYVYQVLIDLNLSYGLAEFWRLFHWVARQRAQRESRILREQQAQAAQVL